MADDSLTGKGGPMVWMGFRDRRPVYSHPLVLLMWSVPRLVLWIMARLHSHLLISFIYRSPHSVRSAMRNCSHTVAQQVRLRHLSCQSINCHLRSVCTFIDWDLTRTQAKPPPDGILQIELHSSCGGMNLHLALMFYSSYRRSYPDTGHYFNTTCAK